MLLGAEVADSRYLCKCTKSMSEAFGDKEAFAADGIRFGGIPLAEGGWTDPNIHHHIEDALIEAQNVFCLIGRNVRKVRSSHRASSRDADVHLLQIK